MSDRVRADKLAKRLVKEAPIDSNEYLLSQQLLRRLEVIERLEKNLNELTDGTNDLINANRDTILRITEEGLNKVKKQCEYITGSLEQSDNIPSIVIKDLREHGRLALKIIEAVNTFHPMHGESWSGWPKE